MLPRLAHGVRDLVEQLAEANQRIDHETCKHGECYCRDKAGDLANTHVYLFSVPQAYARAHNTRNTLARHPRPTLPGGMRVGGPVAPSH